ncbi:uncharacterized protein F4807DRAFT_423848 [Annulohypoxylon truncatum]|uniref:uncharacterized protein n=1 Tax=Annulohypoxylon truncatum TaxID=327061 RepID=UPI002008D7C1|nr:uncharacterized protein F4807DRAFT_423848 [Annulohypoxylon truncatum]KAI1210108.1 hypothetical protein F4807DRAFT_423848 [Annulohypoxylon truncatum]
MGSSNFGDQSEPRFVVKHNRTRPLRTYSKRTAPTDTAEPVSKKRRMEQTSAIPETKDEAVKPLRHSSVSCSSPTLPPPQPIKKGSIMSYFKIMQPLPSSSLISPEPTSGPTEPASTPPSSPPMPNSNRKKRRRLTTRIISRATSEDPNQEDEAEGEDKRLDEIGGRLMASVSPADVLSDASSNTHSQSTAKRKRQLTARKCERNKKEASKPGAVQTTLSLSISDKGFTECKECGMLYNPLHKQDAKYHARRHAAMLKAKSSTHDNEISD